MMVVAGIARRMRDCGLWGDDEVSTEEWLDDDVVKGIPFFLHCLVADGVVQVGRTEDGKKFYSLVSWAKSKNPN
jgi:hypothetical protein